MRGLLLGLRRRLQRLDDFETSFSLLPFVAGTPMRYVMQMFGGHTAGLSLPVSPLTNPVALAPLGSALVASPGRAPTLSSPDMRACTTESPAMVATPADKHLATTPRAQEEPAALGKDRRTLQRGA